MSTPVRSIEFAVATTRPQEVHGDLLFIPVFQDDDALDDLAGIDEATGGEWARARASAEFRARPFELFVTPLVGPGWNARRAGFVGAGPRREMTAERARRLAAAAGYAARDRGALTVAWLVRGGMSAGSAADGLSAAEF